MSQTYFSNFQTMPYANGVAVNITERVVVRNGLAKNLYVYYPLSLEAGIRADQVAYKAYGDPYASWVLYLTNEIVDPYYDWYLSNDQLSDFIITKYGSIANAINTVAYYTNNWVDQTDITPARYDALTANQQSYWAPVYGARSTATSYTRLKIDLQVTTNFILALGTGSNAAAFQENEPVTISYTLGTSGSAQVVQSNSSTLIVQHISGDAFPHDAITINANSFVLGTKSAVNCQVTSCTFLANNIPAEVQDYYSPVVWYDIETAKNAGNRFINVVAPKYEVEIVKNIKKLLSNT